MAKLSKPVLRQRIFEARYRYGYRYLDRCGDAMVILERALPGDTEHVWLPGEIAPTGARLRCPDLDITIVFNSYRFVVDQNPVGKVECDFPGIVSTALATIRARFDLNEMERFGFRRITVVPVDSIDEAEELSTRLIPVTGWPTSRSSRLEPRSLELVCNFELPDRSKGARVALSPHSMPGADVQVDERLKKPPHHLPDGQREALLAQLERARRRRDEPDAGLLIDIDYFWLWPPRDRLAEQFLAEASQEADRLEKDVLQKGTQR